MRHLLAALALLAAVPALAAPPDAPKAKEVQIKVTDNGFEPREVKAKKDQPSRSSSPAPPSGPASRPSTCQPRT